MILVYKRDICIIFCKKIKKERREKGESDERSKENTGEERLCRN